MSATAIAAYLTLFAVAGVGFVFAALLLGWFLRPHAPSATKSEPYECGEPAVGTAYVQFDLRFYVVALIFIIFEVEVAFFFPWAAVFGKLREIRAAEGQPAAIAQTLTELGAAPATRTSASGAATLNVAETTAAAKDFALAALADIGIFFGVLLVGFAYLWRRGDLDWVRALPSRWGTLSLRATTASGSARGSPNRGGRLSLVLNDALPRGAASIGGGNSNDGHGAHHPVAAHPHP